MTWEKSSETTLLEIHRQGAIARVTLNRPEIHNAFNPVLIQEIKGTFQKLAEDDQTRVVILTGAGRSFCAGADLNWMKEMNQYSTEENIEDSRQMALLFHSLEEFPKPLIAQVNGAAMGGGVGLVSVCDFVVAQEKAKFAFSEVKIGLIPAVISPYCLKKIGFSNARHLMLSGEIFLAPKAKEVGLVHEVCTSEDLEEKTLECAKSFLKNGPNAMAKVKFLLNQITSKNLDQGAILKLTAKLIAELRVSPEGARRNPSAF